MHHIMPPAVCRLASRTAPHLARRGFVLVIVAGLGLVVGCGRNRGPAVQFVEGKVVLDGESLEGATVGLSPVKGSTGLPAYARTDGKGIFRVTSTRGGRRDAGAAEGDYVVTVSKVVADEGDVAIDEDGSGKKPARRPSLKPPRNVVPDVYAEVDTSPLRATIKSGANSGPAFVYDLKSPAPKATPGKR
ncbi:MAG: hypothetical protein NTY17_12185 [Planctomycetia bacterium]|nr:hypothetical protein [Planctomycetia bacterium]